MNMEKGNNAIDLSHHLSDLSRRRKTSPLKGLQKYFRPGTIMLAGGLPDPSYFPFASIGGDAMVPDSFALTPTVAAKRSPLAWLWNLLGADNTERTTKLTVPRFAAQPGDIDLATALQYGPAVGLERLGTFIHDFAQRVFRPAFADWTTLVHTGNTDGWSRCVATLCNPGEGMLTEEWTYPSAVALAAPSLVTAVPVAMDAQGMSASALEELLSTWDESARGGMKRPHVMYTVPVGQNPCGMTTGIERKKEIYAICVKYDIIICEDDPYYFLQEGNYVPKHMRGTAERKPGTDSDETERFIRSLSPSYLTIDTEGRVVRLDTFSKTIAPGSRFGFFTCNPVFAERFERQGETTTQRPCGFGQALIGQLLTQQWGLENYFRWLRGLQAQYTVRRDAAVDAILAGFDSAPGTVETSLIKGMPVFVCYAKPKSAGTLEKRKPLLSFAPPTSGMFVWVQVHFENLPASARVRTRAPEDDNPTDLETLLWISIAEAGVLVGPGSFFAADREAAPSETTGNYRIAFSSGPLETLNKAIGIFNGAVHKFFEVEGY